MDLGQDVGRDVQGLGPGGNVSGAGAGREERGEGARRQAQGGKGVTTHEHAALLFVYSPASLPSCSANGCAHRSPCAAIPSPIRWSGLAEHVASNVDDWKRIYDSLEPQNELQHLPAPWGDKLELFQKILVLRLLRPDKVGGGSGPGGRATKVGSRNGRGPGERAQGEGKASACRCAAA